MMVAWLQFSSLIAQIWYITRNLVLFDLLSTPRRCTSKMFLLAWPWTSSPEAWMNGPTDHRPESGCCFSKVKINQIKKSPLGSQTLQKGKHHVTPPLHFIVSGCISMTVQGGNGNYELHWNRAAQTDIQLMEPARAHRILPVTKSLQSTKQHQTTVRWQRLWTCWLYSNCEEIFVYSRSPGAYHYPFIPELQFHLDSGRTMVSGFPTILWWRALGVADTSTERFPDKISIYLSRISRCCRRV